MLDVKLWMRFYFDPLAESAFEVIEEVAVFLEHSIRDFRVHAYLHHRIAKVLREAQQAAEKLLNHSAS